jgi:hypothetical protein
LQKLVLLCARAAEGAAAAGLEICRKKDAEENEKVGQFENTLVSHKSTFGQNEVRGVDNGFSWNLGLLTKRLF